MAIKLKPPEYRGIQRLLLYEKVSELRFRNRFGLPGYAGRVSGCATRTEGNRKLKQAPFPGSDSTHMSPP
jgi:hypothetical protein